MAVVGEPSAETGESVVAHVVRRDPALTAEALRLYARESLTAYKVPAATSSATACRRPMSARCCGARCGTARRWG